GHRRAQRGDHPSAGPGAAQDGLLDGGPPQLGPPHEVPGARAPGADGVRDRASSRLRDPRQLQRAARGTRRARDVRRGPGRDARRLAGTPERVKCETVDLEVPAQAEIVIEGMVPPGVREPEGPFGEFTRYSKGAEGP